MKPSLDLLVDGRRCAALLSSGLAFLLMTGCTSGASADQSGGALLPDTNVSTTEAVAATEATSDVQAYSAPIATLPAPVGNGGSPDTQPIGPGVAPDTQPAVVPGAKWAQVHCGSATMDLPTTLRQVSQYGSGDITTEYASADGKTKVELVCRDRRATDSPNADFQNTKNSLTRSPDYTYNKNNRWVITGPGLLCAGNCPGSDTSEYYMATWYSSTKVFSMLWQYPLSEDKAISPTIDHVYYSFKWNGAAANPVTPGQTQQPVAPIAPAPNSAVTTTRLSLREGPDCNSARLAWIPKGTSIHIERAAVGPEAGWYLVDYQGQTGWASGYYLDGQSITYNGPKLCDH